MAAINWLKDTWQCGECQSWNSLSMKYCNHCKAGRGPRPVKPFDPNAEEGLDFWTKEEYGKDAPLHEMNERAQVVMRLLDCHRLIATEKYEMGGKQVFPVLANEVCGDLLAAVARLLYLPTETAQTELVDVTVGERNWRIRRYVQAVRPSEQCYPNSPILQTEKPLGGLP